MPEGKLPSLLKRSISGAVFVALVVAAIFSGPWATALLFAPVTLLGLHEFYRLADGADSRPRWWGIMAGVVVYGLVFLASNDFLPSEALWFIALLVLIAWSSDMLALNPMPLDQSPVVLGGWVYVSVPFGLIAALATLSGEWDPWMVLGFLLVLWANDTGAYLVGSLIGRTKLLKEVSPGKTWEGLAGGLVLSVVVAWLLARNLPFPTFDGWLLMAACVGVFGNIGDLYESYLKRSAGVKDSGKIMPGHGGVLDRFDGLLFSLPAFLALYTLIYL